MDVHLPNELARLVNLERIYKARSHYIITASKEECQALKKRFDVISIACLEATYDVQAARTQRGGFYIVGTLCANVTQKCVATLQPVVEEVKGEFALHVIDQGQSLQDSLDPEQDEDFEYSLHGEIDLGEITAQYLSLFLNPYPRSPEALEGPRTIDFQEKKNPFSVLEKLKS